MLHVILVGRCLHVHGAGSCNSAISMLAVNRTGFSAPFQRPFNAFPAVVVRPRSFDAPFMSINCSKRSSSSEQVDYSSWPHPGLILDAIVSTSGENEPLGVSPVHQETLKNKVLKSQELR